jgi:hypothetical protein
MEFERHPLMQAYLNYMKAYKNAFLGVYLKPYILKAYQNGLPFLLEGLTEP